MFFFPPEILLAGVIAKCVEEEKKEKEGCILFFFQFRRGPEPIIANFQTIEMPKASSQLLCRSKYLFYIEKMRAIGFLIKINE